MTKLLTSAILSAALFVGGSHALSWPISLVVDCGPPNNYLYNYQITVDNGNHIIHKPVYSSNGQYGTGTAVTTDMKFRFDPDQCGEIKARFEGDLACSAGQYRTNVSGDCIDIPADMSADLQTAEAALAAANTAAVALAANVMAEKDAATAAAVALAAEVMAEKLAATTAAAELAAEVIAEKEFAADLAAELQLALQTAEIALAATNTALAAKNDCNVGQYRKTNNSACTDASTNAPCPVGQYRAEAGGDCKSVQMPAR